MVKLYHYTDFEGAKGIEKSGEIRTSSVDNNSSDAKFGTGVYLTEITPSAPIDTILRNNYGDRANFDIKKHRTECYFEFNFEGEDLDKLSGKAKVQKVGNKNFKRNIWIHHQTLKLNKGTKLQFRSRYRE